MSSPHGKALGVAFAAVWMAVALTACASGQPSAATGIGLVVLVTAAEPK